MEYIGKEGVFHMFLNREQPVEDTAQANFFSRPHPEAERTTRFLKKGFISSAEGQVEEPSKRLFKSRS